MTLIIKILESKPYHWNAGTYSKSDYWKISPMIGMMDVDCCGYITVTYCIGKIVYSEPICKYADYMRVHIRVYLFSCTKLCKCSKALTCVYFILQMCVLNLTHAWTTDARVPLATHNGSVCLFTRVRLHAHSRMCNIASERYCTYFISLL